MKIGDTLSIEIQDIAFGGDGIGRHEGQVVFVPFTAIGDTVEVRIEKAHKSFLKGRVLRILTAAPERVAPRCPYFENCGGCQYQHLNYASQLKLKENQVAESFRRIAKISNPPILPIIASPQEYGYRNRISVHAENGKIGFRGVDARELIDVEQCPISHSEVNDALKALRQSRPEPGHYSLRMASLPPSGFVQANHFLSEPFRNVVRGQFASAAEVALEGYSGGGFFTRDLAAHFQRVVAIESDPRLHRDAARLNLENVEWIEGRVEDFLSEHLRVVHQKASILLDPPREGLPKSVAQDLTRWPAAELVYVSCNPSTLARDAQILKEKYTLQSVQPLDLFPQTAHIECVTRWVKI